MYLKTQLEKFADQIQDDTQAAAFKEVASSIEFDERGLCSGGALEVFTHTNLNNLRRDFEQRHLEFIGTEDLVRIVGM